MLLFNMIVPILNTRPILSDGQRWAQYRRVYEIHSPRQTFALTKLFNMIVPILGHLPQPRLKLFEGLIGSFLRKFIRFLLQINKKRVDVDYFHDLSRTNKTRPSTSSIRWWRRQSVVQTTISSSCCQCGCLPCTLNAEDTATMSSASDDRSVRVHCQIVNLLLETRLFQQFCRYCFEIHTASLCWAPTVKVSWQSVDNCSFYVQWSRGFLFSGAPCRYPARTILQHLATYY